MLEILAKNLSDSSYRALLKHLGEFLILYKCYEVFTVILELQLTLFLHILIPIIVTMATRNSSTKHSFD